MIGKIIIKKSGWGIFTEDVTNKEFEIHPKKLNKAFNNDIVEIKRGNNDHYEVKKVIERTTTDYVGVVQTNKKMAFVITKQTLPGNVDFFVENRNSIEIFDKDLVLVRYTGWDSKNPTCEIIECYGNIQTQDAQNKSVINDYDILNEFTEEEIEEANLIKYKFDNSLIDFGDRVDLRNIKTFKIDPFDSKDADDALSIEIDKTIKIGIHIADVSHFIKKDTLLYKAAFERGNSTYLTDKCIPMFPEQISNDICSLNESVDRLCFSVVVEFNKDTFDIINTDFIKTVINVKHALSYEDAQEIIDTSKGYYASEIVLMDTIAKKLRKDRGSIEFNSKELQFNLDENNSPLSFKVKKTGDSNRLIEEFMLLANRLVGNKIASFHKEGLFRVHGEPNENKLNEVYEFIKEVEPGFILKGKEINFMDKLTIKKLLDISKDKWFEDIVGSLVVRSMAKAKYGVNPTGHYGLGMEIFKNYTHFTSPIRRINDLFSHFMLFDIIEGKLLKKEYIKKYSNLSLIATHISKKEVDSANAERQSKLLKLCEYLSKDDMCDKVFEGYISKISGSNIVVSVPEILYEGLLIDGNLKIKNNKVFNDTLEVKIGQKIEIVVKSINLYEQKIVFKMLNII